MMAGIVIPYRGFPIETLRPVVEAWEKEYHGDQFGIELTVDASLADLLRLANGPMSALLVLVQGGPVGYIGIDFWPNPAGPGLMASEKYWYVMPEARGRDSLKLLKSARDYARQAGASKMLFTASRMASNLHDKVCRIYEHMGMRHFETTYCCDLSQEKGGA